ncbi:MAG TPA: TetR/AcrR family transcriptional regulator [Solirubrobacteraceae bacterium]|nr:TetR/AcrR family transcriptional regulator [Solirubrobacteraceae bacterium]
MSPARRGNGIGLPRGPQALPREAVAAHQRERLFKAIVEAVNEDGFAATTISDLVSRAGISRRTFYEHFHNKEECLLAAYDAIIERLTRRLIDATRSADDWTEQLEAFIGEMFNAVGDRPDLARLVCVEMGAAGPVGVQRWAEGSAVTQSFITEGFRRAPGRGTLPDPVARAMVGALRKILYSRVRSEHSSKGLHAELLKVLPDLVGWIALYYPSPEGIPIRPRRRHSRRLVGGRAPGTLSPPSLMGTRGLPRGDHNLPRGFVIFNQRERIFDAIANLTATKGYSALSLEDIAAEAAVSLQTFYSHFANKEDAFLATYEVGHAKSIGLISQTLAGQAGGVAAVRASVSALLEFLASEPSYAHLACVDVLIAHPRVANRLDEANAFYAELLTLLIGNNAPSPPSPITGEAIVGGVFELLHDYILRGHTDDLPELADHIMYIALTPFMGSEEAWAATKASA